VARDCTKIAYSERRVNAKLHEPVRPVVFSDENTYDVQIISIGRATKTDLAKNRNWGHE